ERRKAGHREDQRRRTADAGPGDRPQRKDDALSRSNSATRPHPVRQGDASAGGILDTGSGLQRRLKWTRYAQPELVRTRPGDNPRDVRRATRYHSARKWLAV